MVTTKIRLDKFIFLFFLAIFLPSHTLYSQDPPSNVAPEEDSAEVFLEEYTDKFQEKFFGALKQKGIENYDRAINLLLECKTLQEDNATLSHELAKTYFLNKQYIPAQQYALEALRGEPENYWFLHTLMTVLEKQSNAIEAVKDRLPTELEGFQKNLALLYVKKEQYAEASKALKKVKDPIFKQQLKEKIAEATAVKTTRKKANVPAATIVNDPTKENNPITTQITALEALLKNGDYQTIEVKSMEAMESYPLQPYFYYAHGVALNKNGKPNEAVDVLLTALDYMFEEGPLTLKIYQELANAYTALGNTSKANEYLAKVKRGS